jgi:type IX secretion system substrate protein
MKKFIFTFSLLLTAPISNAQITFQKTYGGTGDDMGYSVQQTTDGGYIIAGSTDSYGAGDYDIYLIRTDSIGDTLWTRTFGGSGADFSWCTQQTLDGGFIISGSYDAGDDDVYLIKTDASGNLTWNKTYGGQGDDWGYSIQQTSDSGYIITGYTSSFATGSVNVYLIKTDSNGNSLWTKTLGGSANDGARCVKQTADGGYIIAGSTGSFGIGSRNVYLIKTDNNGNPLWSKTFGGSGIDEAFSVSQTIDGGYIIAGSTDGFGSGGSDVYLIKTDSNGDTLWTKTFGAIDGDYGQSVQQTFDGGYIITGWTYNFGSGIWNMYLIKTDTIGNLEWTKVISAIIASGHSIQQTTDGGYIIAGSGSSLGPGHDDFYLIKTDSLGNSGCNDGSTTTIVITPPTQVSNPATIVTSPGTIVGTPTSSPYSGGVVTTLCLNVGINEIATNNLFLIQPNPATDNFTISFEKMILNGNVIILNIFGENVFAESIFNEYQKEINLKNIAGGIYFVKVFNGEKSYCKKLIVE